MEFGEKLLALRKKEGMSQEVLSERLNTSRQAISKWENGQGFPETEKLLKISNIFNVSVDYLLKSSVEQKEEKEGYYVSREVAEAFLSNESKIYKNVLMGVITIISAYIPYLLFKGRFEIYVIIVSIMVAVGVGFFIKGIILEDNYKMLKKQALTFDEKVLKDLNDKYSTIKNKYRSLIGIGVCSICSGLAIFFFLKNGLISEVNNAEYQIICILLVSIGIFISGYFTSIIESYELLIKNEKYTNKLSFKLERKIQDKINNM
ncbi:XRE family transcriptional regulator [Romboutsia weinsteinii]|uniref:XRE family transcriptional regulator n=1 Tax=Romboutsia weinsteinii TaxID=2020949 RepID=A0A371IZ67_9FIRM|nr:helix-turn-helix transcriptional regulator [Romboutsia weinsteinii]RDY25775.1 XRE family transcriptional regulator [Romboutsia weinsteinii]